MSVLYFTEKWPRRAFSSLLEKSFNMIETLVNENKKITIASSDQKPAPDDMQLYPFTLWDVNPQKINTSLNKLTLKPDLIFYDNWRTQQQYSAFTYNRWNQCSKLLEVNKLEGLEKWRKQNYVSEILKEQFISKKTHILPENIQDICLEDQRQAIFRSDIILCGNDFIYYALKKAYPHLLLTLFNQGLPTKQYRLQINDLQFRPFQQRENFLFFGDFEKETTIDHIKTLLETIWPLISNKLPEAQLHIYGSNYGPAQKHLFKNIKFPRGVQIMGYMKQDSIISEYRALLYPAIYSSGNKAKILDSWYYHTPVVTTPIGAQGRYKQVTQPILCFNLQRMQGANFLRQRKLSDSQNQEMIRIKQFYDSNCFGPEINKLSFGGLHRNYNAFEFAQSAVELYTNKQLWQSCLKQGQTTILKNENQNQLVINLKIALTKLEVQFSNRRKGKLYSEQWNRYLKSSTYHQKMKAL